MKIMSFGIDYSTGRSIVEPIDEQDFSRMILGSFPHETLSRASAETATARSYKAEVRARSPNLDDPLSVGWKFLVSNKDPLKEEIIKAVEPLAKHRGMKDPSQPLIYNCNYEYEWMDWIRNNCWSLSLGEAPYYVLIIGGPEQVPFRFQSTLDSAVAVGRANFDSIEDLKEYVKKVIRLEKAENPVVDREVIMFAPNWGLDDPTFFSKTFMAQPLSQHIKDTLNFQTTNLFENDATKEKLINTVAHSAPTLVYTASHGLGAPNEDMSIQKRYNGAICCQNMRGIGKPPQGTYSVDDVPDGGAYAEGSVFFNFSCYGYGTPARSDFYHWTRRDGLKSNGNPRFNAAEDFISALPKKLLAHPRGPIGFFGHVDTAWLHGFADPVNPYILERWSSRMGPFKKAVETILSAHTLGLVLNSMNSGYSIGSLVLTNAYDRIASGAEVMTSEKNSRLVDYWIARTDAQNYMLFGDPGTHVRIPA
jgi:hypothetical protein